MITNSKGKEVRLITLDDLCRTCMCNKHDILIAGQVESVLTLSSGRHGVISTCTNKADGCDGFTLNESCPIWKGLQDIVCLNV
jgi:hypothetical protein